MFMTGLLSLCMLLLAPMMGAKKILKYIQPLLELLRQVPYATWIISVLKKWWNGTYDFDSLPQDMQEYAEQRRQMDDDDVMDDAMEDMNDVHARMQKAVNRANNKGKDPVQEEKPVKKENLDEDDHVRKAQRTVKRTQEDLREMYERQRITYFIEFNHNIDNPMYLVKYGKLLEKIIALPQDALEDWFCAMWIEKSGRIYFKGKIYSSLTEAFKALGIETEGMNVADDVIVTEDVDFSDEEKDEIDSDEFPLISPKIGDGGLLDRTVKERMSDDIYAEVIKATEPAQIDPQGLIDDIREWIKESPNDFPEEGRRPFSKKIDGQETPVQDWISWIWKEIVNTPSEIRRCFQPTYVENYQTEKLMRTSLWIPTNNGKPWEPRKHVTSSVDPSGLWTVFVAYMKVHGKGLLKGAALIVVFWTLMSSMNANLVVKKDEEDITLSAEPQGSNRGNKRGGAPKRKGKRKFIINSGGDQQQEDHDHMEEYNDEDADRLDANDEERMYVPSAPSRGQNKKTLEQYVKVQKGVYPGHSSKSRGKKDIPTQAVEKPIVLPNIVGESIVRNKIRKSKQPIQLKAATLLKFRDTAQKAQLSTLKPQSFNTNNLSAGVFKFYRFNEGSYKYCCTGTHVGNKMWVVLHCMSEELTANYRAVNHTATFDFKGSEMMVYGDQLACFPVSGYASPFKGSSLKVLEDAAIVTIFGYGNGQLNSPDSVTGFASPEGWCNAKTRDGDCTSPVLNEFGQIVGFWTHGDGKLFGRFEKVTPELIEFAKNGSSTIHVGMDFQFRPPSL
jgi:hypothetical protein